MVNKMRNSVVLVAAGALLVLALAGCDAPLDTRAWQYGSGEQVRLGSGWEVALPPKWTARIDLPLAHRPGDPDPVDLPMTVYGPSGRRYVVAVETKDYARDRVASDKSLIARGEYPDTVLKTAVVDGMQVDLSITNEANGVTVEAYYWRGDDDPLWIQAEDDSDLTRMVRSHASSEDIARLLLSSTGVREAVTK